MSTLGIVAATVGFGTIGVYRATRRTTVTTQIPLKTLPKKLDGLKILHLSDIHIGNAFRPGDVATLVDEANATNADIIAITGDIVDGRPAHIASWLSPLSKLRAKYGIYYCTGNHENMWHAAKWCEILKKYNINVLNNTHQLLKINGEPLAIAGATDYSTRANTGIPVSDPAAALANIDPAVFKIMLVHNPKSVNPSLAHGAHFVMAGHTHGGQIFPANLIVSQLFEYVDGLYMRNDRAIFVSCGTGYWGPPLRLGAPRSELNIHILKSQS